MIIYLTSPARALLCIVVNGDSKDGIIRFNIEAEIFSMTLVCNYLIQKFVHSKVKNVEYNFSLVLVMILFC